VTETSTGGRNERTKQAERYRAEEGVTVKGKIDKNGVLWIQRGKKLQKQFCHRGGMIEGYGHGSCCDDCPLFGEPELNWQEQTTYLEICESRMLEFGEFADERGRA
jgi:hypothetical protein